MLFKHLVDRGPAAVADHHYVLMVELTREEGIHSF